MIEYFLKNKELQNSILHIIIVWVTVVNIEFTKKSTSKPARSWIPL